MITSNATGGSGGINTAAYSRNTGGGGLAGRATTLVEGVAGGGGGGGYGGGGRRQGGEGSGSGLARRRHPAAQWQRQGLALDRRDPARLRTQQGRDLRDLQPRAARRPVAAGQGGARAEDRAVGRGGRRLRVVSSELKASELEAKLLARIRQFDFGAKDVEQMVVTWPVDFLPS